MNRLFALISFVVLFALGIQLKLDTPKIVEVEEELITKPKKLKKKKDDFMSERRPASSDPFKQTDSPNFKAVDKDGNVFQDAPEELAQNSPETVPEDQPFQTVQNQGPSSFIPTPRPQREPSQNTKSSSRGDSSSAPKTGSVLGASPRLATPGTEPCLFCMSPPRADSDADEDPASDDGSSGGGGGSPSLICTASVGSGSFANPFNISLTCSTAADIKFTISENTCGDPDLGSAYTSSFILNPGAGTYCLSFKGTTSAGVESDVVEKFYTFNPALPDIQAAHTKKFFQTTELQGLMSVTSSDFSDADYSMGVVNTKTFDPGPAGWLCHEIVEDPSTTRLIPMADTNVSGFSVSSQVDVYFKTTNLEYGNNFVTSYLRNNSFTEPVYSCSTTNIVLEDFPYFDSNPHQGYTGTNDVREFSGGFTHLGFFEPEPTVYRGPAGSDSETSSSQELETGIFGIFY